MSDLIILIIAVLIDYKVGDPAFLPHPISAIGKLIALIEKGLRKIGMANKLGGGILWLLVNGVVIGVLTLALEGAGMIHPYVKMAMTLYLLFASLAATCLKAEVMKVATSLRVSTIELSRQQLSYLVGRDTSDLDAEEIIKATVETTAENTIDGILAPLFYICIGMLFGCPVQMVFLYKTVNTLDSMVGYIQEPYKNIGFVSAKIDDIFNYIPARIGSFIMILAGGVLGLDSSMGFRIWRRDRRNHKSPNAGYPEAATAGLLNIKLGGTHAYFGEVLDKPTIGDDIRAVKIDDIETTTKIMYMAEFIFLMMGVSVIYLLR